MSQATGSAGTNKTAATAKASHPTYEKMIKQSLTALAVSWQILTGDYTPLSLVILLV